MKAKGILLIILSIFLLGACEQLDGFLEDFSVSMTTDYIEVEVLVPPGPADKPISISTPMQTDVEHQIKEGGYANATIQSIKLADAVLQIDESSPEMDFNAIDTLATAVRTDSLPVVTAASCKNNLTDTRSLTMNTLNAELEDYILTDNYTLITSGMLKENLTDTLRVKAKIRFRIKLLVSGI